MATRTLKAETRITGTRYWWWVRIYDTADQLREAAHRHHSWYGRAHWDGCFGVHQPVPYRERVTGSGKWEILAPPNNLLGVIRLCRPFTYEQVAHEATHAALFAYRTTKSRDVRLGIECGPREELLCYMVGEIIDSIMGQVA